MSVEAPLNFEKTISPRDKYATDLMPGADIALNLRSRENLLPPEVVAIDRGNTHYGLLDKFKRPETLTEKNVGQVALSGARVAAVRAWELAA